LDLLTNGQRIVPIGLDLAHGCPVDATHSLLVVVLFLLLQ
jgi:hypothetical protein